MKGYQTSPRGRLLAAFVTGTALFVGSAILLGGEFAGARGAFTMSAPLDIAPAFVEPAAPVERASRPHVKSASAYGRRAVCVRLCDGFFFPSVLSSGGDGACESQCPDAPTAFYSMPAGSDKIEDAVSLGGEPYTALPVADHNRLSFDSTCTCHRSFTSRAYEADLLRDRTLRPGDLVMTDKGFTVFTGEKSGAVSAASFVPLNRSTNIPKGSRPELTAMERAGNSDRQSGPYSFSSAAAAAPSVAAAPRPRKGTVTVDDEAAPSK